MLHITCSIASRKSIVLGFQHTFLYLLTIPRIALLYSSYYYLLLLFLWNFILIYSLET